MPNKINRITNPIKIVMTNTIANTVLCVLKIVVDLRPLNMLIY